MFLERKDLVSAPVSELTTTSHRYGGIRSKRESMAAQALAARRPSSATIRAGPGAEGGEEVEEDESSHLNFAQKLLLGESIYRDCA